MKKLFFALLLLSFTFGHAQDIPKKERQVKFIPYITIKENIYNPETANRYQLNPTIGITAEYHAFDLKAFYGTTITEWSYYGKQLTGSVGGLTLTYNFYEFIYKIRIIPYATCRLNIYDIYHYGYNPALGLALNYDRFSFRLFDGLNFRNNKFTDITTLKSNGTTNTYNLVAATVWGISLTYNFGRY